MARNTVVEKKLLFAATVAKLRFNRESNPELSCASTPQTQFPGGVVAAYGMHMHISTRVSFPYAEKRKHLFSHMLGLQEAHTVCLRHILNSVATTMMDNHDGAVCSAAMKLFAAVAAEKLATVLGGAPWTADGQRRSEDAQRVKFARRHMTS